MLDLVSGMKKKLTITVPKVTSSKKTKVSIVKLIKRKGVTRLIRIPPNEFIAIANPKHFGVQSSER